MAHQITGYRLSLVVSGNWAGGSLRRVFNMHLHHLLGKRARTSFYLIFYNPLSLREMRTKGPIFLAFSSPFLIISSTAETGT